jgi:hypothetical protein
MGVKRMLKNQIRSAVSSTAGRVVCIKEITNYVRAAQTGIARLLRSIHNG